MKIIVSLSAKPCRSARIDKIEPFDHMLPFADRGEA
jgi:hypothetical protein